MILNMVSIISQNILAVLIEQNILLTDVTILHNEVTYFQSDKTFIHILSHS